MLLCFCRLQFRVERGDQFTSVIGQLKIFHVLLVKNTRYSFLSIFVLQLPLLPLSNNNFRPGRQVHSHGSFIEFGSLNDFY